MATKCDRNLPEFELEPWERQAGETEKSWAAFVNYRDLPAGERTLANAYRKTYGKEAREAPAFFRQWSARHRWSERVAAYDRHLDQQRVLAADREAAKVAKTLARRREMLRDRGWKTYEDLIAVADRLIAKVDQMLLTPIHKPQEVTDEDGTRVVLMPTDKWAMRDAASFARAAANIMLLAEGIGRLSAEIETDRILVRMFEELDFSKLTDDELEQLRRIKDPDELKRTLHLIQGGKHRPE